MKSTIAQLEQEMKNLQARIDELRAAKPKDVHIAAKAVEQFYHEHGIGGDLTRDKFRKLNKIAKQMGYNGKESALRTTFLFRKYWIQMEDIDWS